MAEPLALELHHASFCVADLDRSLAFYEGVLGLTRLPRPNLPVEGVWLSVGTAQIHLIAYHASIGDIGTRPPTANPAAQHLALRVNDLASTRALLESAGLSVTTTASRSQFWIQDPDGHILEFMTT